ncbi:MAG: flagellar motor protein MotD [Hydrogenophilales bacterium 17-61-76]|nr:MAG: flagellar motor protein MotD [Hydrogenophilales bacterium 17-61-76]
MRKRRRIDYDHENQANSLGDAFGNAPASEAARVPELPSLKLPPEVRQRTLKQQQYIEEQTHMTDVANTLLAAMGPLVKEGKVKVSQSRRGVSIEINANVLFDPGQARLHPYSLQVLQTVAAALKNEPFKLEVTGHTDNVQISNSSFASNWELSAMRATSVVRLLAANGIDPERLLAIGSEASKPIASNDTEDGRARNRRVELMVLSGLPDIVEEIPLAPPVVQTNTAASP